MNRLSMNHQCVGQTDRLADSICRYTLHRQKFNAKFCKHLLKYQQKSHGVLLILTLYDTKITCKIKGHQNRNAFRLTVMSYFYCWINVLSAHTHTHAHTQHYTGRRQLLKRVWLVSEGEAVTWRWRQHRAVFLLSGVSTDAEIATGKTFCMYAVICHHAKALYN